MGGKALKKVETRRYNLEEYKETSSFIISELKKILLYSVISDIPYLREKETFGDLDVLVSFNTSTDIQSIMQIILNHFQPDEHIKNGKVLTFNYKDLQVDIVFTPLECFPLSLTYYSWNDAGMLLGRICHYLGLKYGPEYLRLLVLNDNDRVCDIPLTNDPKIIFSILGLDFEIFKNGFDNYTQLFDFISTSKYFYYDIFDSALINSASRRRDNKRVSLHLFFEYLTLNQERWKHSNKKRTQDENIEFIDKLFPEKFIYNTIAEANRKIEIKRLVSEKWNGNIIMSIIPDLVDSKLGNAINKHKEYVKSFDLDFEYYILNNDFDKILNDFKLVNEL